MKIFKTVLEMQKWSNEQRKSDQKIGFVPTMGALHEGHLALVKKSNELADKTIVSIFVNPAQFGPNEDFDKYPRDEKNDLKKCEDEGVSAVFIPEVREIYTKNFQTYVEVNKVSKNLCGASRPIHFRGVATIVLKLFNSVNPNLAIFGEKDFQQLTVLKRMTKDLNLPIDIIGYPIVREQDGLAMSSRNKYLSLEERKKALCLFNAINEAKKVVEMGETNTSVIIATAESIIETAGGKIEYVEIVDPENLGPIEKIKPKARLMLAAYIGKTRLIDNARMA